MSNDYLVFLETQWAKAREARLWAWGLRPICFITILAQIVVFSPFGLAIALMFWASIELFLRKMRDR